MVVRIVLNGDDPVSFRVSTTVRAAQSPWAAHIERKPLVTTAGRGRVNIHGALNLENFDAPFVEPTTVDGTSAVQLLAKIEARNPDKR